MNIDKIITNDLPFISASAVKFACYHGALSAVGPPLFLIHRDTFNALNVKRFKTLEKMKIRFKEIIGSSSSASSDFVMVEQGSVEKEKLSLKNRVGYFLDANAAVISKGALLILTISYIVSFANSGSLEPASLLKRVVKQGLIEYGWMTMTGCNRLSPITLTRIFALNLNTPQYLRWVVVGGMLEALGQRSISFLARQLIN